MRSKYKIIHKDYPYFVTSTTVDWIPLFNNYDYAKLLFENITFYQKSYFMVIIAYVIMPEHFHMIAKCDNLSKALQSLKSYSAKEILGKLKNENEREILERLRMKKLKYKKESNYQFWQEGFHPKQIINGSILRQKIEYIHANPIRRGLVKKAADWKFSSAAYYETEIQSDIIITPYQM